MSSRRPAALDAGRGSKSVAWRSSVERLGLKTLTLVRLCNGQARLRTPVPFHGISETLSWLYSLEGRGEIYKLERMDQALALIGDPHLKLRAVHIAGTKGKGSVAAMLDACLRAAGFRCALYTKPHLVNLSERTRINGAEMPTDFASK